MGTKSPARRRAREAARSRLCELRERERRLWLEGRRAIAGVDEAGAGPLAGPVVAAAVILPSGVGLFGVDDSKKLPAAKRAALAATIRRIAVAHAVVAVDPEEIDRLDILRASLEAMRRAVAALMVRPDFLLVDARTVPGTTIAQEGIVRGDARCHVIAAASILAKCERDRRMEEYDATYPGYGFAMHKGYATAEHREAIRRLGPCPIHRRSFTLLPPPKLWD